MATVLFGVESIGQNNGGRSQADKLFARATPDDYMGDEGCASCHAEKAAAFKASPHAALVADPSRPLGKKGCEGCHGPGGIHRAEENAENINFRTMSPKESAAACLRCHGSTLSETHWKRSAHSRADLSCVSCHQIHPDSDPNWEPGVVKKGDSANPKKALFVARVEPKDMLKADEPTLCGQCHGAAVAQFRLASHHPVPEGRLACSDCHNAHPNKNEKVNRPGTKDACVTCHAEVAGPFVFEHDPVAGHSSAGCAECHKAHGSANKDLMNSSSRGLCAQCHTEKLATHYPGRTCWQAGCHVAPHGSNTSSRFLSK
ncbi:MAG: cytochrome c3 family protein [Fimbriimonadales bacterium]